jgi:hypothetical protein
MSKLLIADETITAGGRPRADIETIHRQMRGTDILALVGIVLVADVLHPLVTGH